jgi:deferrochelatase/peroxidase EfeB
VNPRNDRTVRGINFQNRRMIRRGIAYGRAFDPQHPCDMVERGLLGYFIMASLADQFEFVLKESMSGGGFSERLRSDVADPFFPFPEGKPHDFPIPGAEASNRTLEQMPPFVRCRAIKYLFLPSLTALRHIAGLVGQ